MSASNTETETETETGSPDQHPECEFDADDPDIPDAARYWYDLEEWECSRPVWEEASENRCVWHASDGQTQGKPRVELEKTVDDGDLYGADLSEASLYVADLSGADFQFADLSGADLEVANLSGADLRAADLSGATLRYADLSGATLRYADLSGADLEDANLSGADLEDADLSGADLEDADLSGADLSYITVENIGVNNFTKFGSRLPTWLPGPPHARAYHDFRSEVSNRGYDKLARDLYFLEQKARTRAAVPNASGGRISNLIFQLITFVGGLLSGLFTGYGVRPRRVFLSTILVIIGTTLWFNQAGIVYDGWNTTYELLGREFNTGSVYYSVTTFVTAAPHPPQSTGLLTNLLVTLETYVGTVLTLLLGYALSTRSRI